MPEKLLLAIVVTFCFSCLQQLSTPTAKILPQIEQTRYRLASLLTPPTHQPSNAAPSAHP
ncbi:hypothetical protein [Myxacorys almedinensis]|uniref:Uncharacterized protein n=1 Tax=Myxacorys almedinensis A TaxID=2690445 RepID=A0A8J8CHK7_9CYAN|nr:hypothetical protein [Myxacorys almedinensis]NDJ16759.1 hypothetical protein [Myxacorys almedinensis A]